MRSAALSLDTSYRKQLQVTMAVSIRSVRAVRPSARVASVRPTARPVSRLVVRADPVSGLACV